MKHRKTVRQGFTLLEIMISVAILSLGLATVFGNSIMTARGTAHSRMVTQAALLAQCRMVEVEAFLRRDKLPNDDQDVEDPVDTDHPRCCEAPFTCSARVEKIELPNADSVNTAAGDRLLNNAAGAARGSSLGGDGGAGALGQLASTFGAMSGGAGAGAAGISGILGGAGGAGGMAGNGAPDLNGIATQLLTSVYPALKPALEGAIRKLTVRVRWNEGDRPFTVEVVQYVTNPGQTLQSETGPAPGTPPPGGAGGPGGQTPPGAPRTPTPAGGLGGFPFGGLR